MDAHETIMAASESTTISRGLVEDEDDYMNMIIVEPIAPKQNETYTQRRLRKEREAEARGRAKSKVEKAAEGVAARESALSRSLISDLSSVDSNKGLAMMAKMGFKLGTTLGSGKMEARTEPITINMKDDRGGVGMDSEKKRKFREEVEREGKRAKAEEGEYRVRVRREREEQRLEAMIAGAMRTAERMAVEQEELEAFRNGEEDNDRNVGKKRTISTKPLARINILWRGLVREREEKERDRRMRYDLHQSLSRLPTYDDRDEDKEDKEALGKLSLKQNLVEDLEEEDLELDAFNALEPVERLRRLILYLREEHSYCFWCKFSYPDKEMDGCPGLTEEDHD